MLGEQGLGNSLPLGEEEGKGRGNALGDWQGEIRLEKETGCQGGLCGPI